MTAVTLGVMAGLALAGAAVLAVRFSDRSRAAEEVVSSPRPLPPGVAEVLAVLGSSGIVLDSSDHVVNNSPAAAAHGLVRGGELVHAELLQLARTVRRDGVIREDEFELRKGIGDARTVVAARVAPLGGHHLLLLVDDRSVAARVERVRRDFVANVSHELKTPVGGISLLAEAIVDAHDDPEAVARFAQRISVESERLARLVREIVELSRVQGVDVISDPGLVDVAACARDAIDRSRLLAEQSRVELASSFEDDCHVWGDEDLITSAVANLLVNAVTYSDPGTRVALNVRRGPDGIIETTVTDQGVGIATADQTRIFERFYRVDAARSRRTGGTGLGLSIVKHVAENHGGQVSVWSSPDQGSTFTLRLPSAERTGPPERSAPLLPLAPTSSSSSPAPHHPEGAS